MLFPMLSKDAKGLLQSRWESCRGGPLWPPQNRTLPISRGKRLPVWGDHRGSPLHEYFIRQLCNRAACIESLLKSSIIVTGRMKIAHLRFGMAKTTKSKPARKDQGKTTKIAVIAA